MVPVEYYVGGAVDENGRVESPRSPDFIHEGFQSVRVNFLVGPQQPGSDEFEFSQHDDPLPLSAREWPG